MSNRREFITLLGGVAVSWPAAAGAQQSALPIIGVVNAGSPDPAALRVAAFRKGLSETGYVEGQNVAVEYHWFGGEYDRLPMLMAAQLLRRWAQVLQGDFEKWIGGVAQNTDAGELGKQVLEQLQPLYFEIGIQ